ncbi:hypothetical protein BC826DRAFT_1167210 [Russula brevipes]|nr:hypothetical protein BC826DRAFT_1167210 [Russula brevipes]
MGRNVIECLNDVPLLHIWCYTNWLAHFISTYHASLSGSQAMWANKKYHSHCSLPLDIIAEVKCSVLA